MKRSIVFGLSTFLSLASYVTKCDAQVGGVGQTGLGGAGGLGLGAGAATGTNRQAARPGAFGGPGVTGVALKDFSTIRAGSVFSGGQSAGGTGAGGLPSAGGAAGNAAGGATAGGSIFGANAFGGNAAGGGLGGGLGGLGGGLGGLGGGLGGLGGLGGGLGGLGGLGGMNNRNRNQGTSGNNRNQNQVRAIVQPDIEISESRKSEIVSLYATRLKQYPFPAKLKGVNVASDAGVVRLTGVVATPADKKLAERMLMLEPGVDSVVNEIVVEAK